MASNYLAPADATMAKAFMAATSHRCCICNAWAENVHLLTLQKVRALSWGTSALLHGTHP